MAKKLGIALGAGGAWGIASLGVIKVLRQEGIDIDYIAGSSMGALIGAAYASNFAGEDTLKKVEEIVSQMRLRASVSFNRLDTFGLFSPHKIGAGFEKVVGKINFEDLPIPLSIVATNFKTGEEVIFNKGPLTPAITGSCAFAFLFTPFEHNGILLTDGGLSNPTPADIVRNMGADVVIGIDLTSKRNLHRVEEVYKFKQRWHHKIIKYIPPLHYLMNRRVGGSLSQIIDLLFTNMNKYKLSLNPPDFLLVPQVTHLNQFGFDLAPEFIKEGEKVAREILPDLKKLLKN